MKLNFDPRTHQDFPYSDFPRRFLAALRDRDKQPQVCPMCKQEISDASRDLESGTDRQDSTEQDE